MCDWMFRGPKSVPVLFLRFPFCNSTIKAPRTLFQLKKDPTLIVGGPKSLPLLFLRAPYCSHMIIHPEAPVQVVKAACLYVII